MRKAMCFGIRKINRTEAQNKNKNIKLNSTMSSGPGRPSGPKGLILDEEECTLLSQHFDSHRKQLYCTSCHAQGNFRYHGTTKTDPAQPMFRCTSCDKTFMAPAIVQLLAIQHLYSMLSMQSFCSSRFISHKKKD
jgi:hypothetical protein